MISTVVFSKARPLQLFAYLESLFHYSQLPQSSVNVLYREVDSIPYHDVKESFPEVNWIVEKDFYQDLVSLISCCADYVLWGCDDVFFKSHFNPQICAKALSDHEQLLAFSLRLGKNIQPTQELRKQDGYYVWDWTTSPLTSTGWTYPWEVSASIYRKEDILKVLKLTDSLRNPNLLEGLIATYYFETHGRAWRKQLACFEVSKSITLQINQVQDIYPENEFDISQETEIDQLYRYFRQGKRLDWKFFENCLNVETHVGLPYFKLRDAAQEQSSFHHEPAIFLRGSENLLLHKPPESPENCLELAHALVSRGCSLDAIAWCHHAIALRPQWSKAYQQLGYTHQMWGLWGKNFSIAESAYQRAIQLAPQLAENYYYLGCLYQESGKTNQAIEAYRQALTCDPNLIKVHWSLGNLLQSEGYLSEAIKHHTHMLQLEWSVPIPDYDLAALCNQGHIDVALSYALEVIRRGLQRPDAINICYGLTASFVHQGNYHQAIALGLRILQHQPTFSAMLSLLKEALEKLGRTYESMACLVGMIPHHVVREFAVDSVEVDITFCGKKAADTTCKYSTVSEEIQVYLPPAKGIQAREHQFMIGGAWSYSPKKIVTVSQGRVWSDPSTTAIFSSKDELIEDLSYGNSFLVASSRHLPNLCKFNGRLAVLAIRYSGNYCHWMFEFVGRAALLQKAYPNWEGLDGILIDPAQAGFQVETLRALGIPDHKLIRNGEGTHLKAEELIVPSLFEHWPVFDPETCKTLRNLFLNNGDVEIISGLVQYPKRIYLTRSEATYRRVLNDDEVQSWLAKAGFTAVTLSQFSVREQAALLSRAEVVVAPHGAGLTNLVFCQSGTKILEIFPHTYSQPYYWLLANRCKLIYRYLVGRPLTSQNQNYLFKDLEDIEIDLDDLAQSLKLLSVEISN